MSGQQLPIIYVLLDVTSTSAPIGNVQNMGFSLACMIHILGLRKYDSNCSKKGMHIVRCPQSVQRCWKLRLLCSRFEVMLALMLAAVGAAMKSLKHKLASVQLLQTK